MPIEVVSLPTSYPGLIGFAEKINLSKIANIHGERTCDKWDLSQKIWSRKKGA
jgi:hypothetical protein